MLEAEAEAGAKRPAAGELSDVPPLRRVRFEGPDHQVLVGEVRVAGFDSGQTCWRPPRSTSTRKEMQPAPMMKTDNESKAKGHLESD